MNTTPLSNPPALDVRGPLEDRFDDVLTPDALAFVATLAAEFDGERRALLEQREVRQEALDRGALPDFLAETQSIRDGDWRVAPVPADLQDRRVEITGPVDRKMVINALNSGAKVFMADFEDSSAPSWSNMIGGQINMADAVRRTITFDAPNGKHYALNDDPAVLLVRPRGLHLIENHLQLDDTAVGGSIVDFALYLFHNAAELKARGTGPYYYLPKLEHHLEARWWNNVIDRAEDLLGLDRGTVKVTVLIETLHAGFQMDEILYELREHIVGLNCGRWDYIFSYIKAFRAHPDRVLPDRAQVTMAVGFLKAYSLLLIKTCHRRGAHAMGGMAAQIPVKNDPEANAAALEKVRVDKEREASNGHDGTWVAHPALIPLAMEIFDSHMPNANQVDRLREDVEITRDDLIAVPDGTITEAGVRGNLRVAIEYLAAWIGGNGCVPIDNLMED
ncbi:MAG: malate synthase A, partial [Pseudomonadota bacterium]